MAPEASRCGAICHDHHAADNWRPAFAMCHGSASRSWCKVENRTPDDAAHKGSKCQQCCSLGRMFQDAHPSKGHVVALLTVLPQPCKTSEVMPSASRHRFRRRSPLHPFSLCRHLCPPAFCEHARTNSLHCTTPASRMSQTPCLLDCLGGLVVAGQLAIPVTVWGILRADGEPVARPRWHDERSSIPPQYIGCPGTASFRARPGTSLSYRIPHLTGQGTCNQAFSKVFGMGLSSLTGKHAQRG